MKVKHRIITIMFLSLVILPGCEEWLDITPASSLRKDDLFKSETGFEDVLHGVYLSLLDSRLYGRELTYGFADVLAQYYTNIPTTPLHTYNQAQKYNYEAANVKAIINNIWRRMYNSIANCNVILDNIDKSSDIFTGDNYHRIKGETLALRAFMHFELLRMFAPAYSEETRNQPGVPYIDRFTNIRVPFSTLEVTYQKIEQDLIAARELLEPFDILGPVDETTGTSTLWPRKAMLNYYGATLLLARMHLYKGEHANALQYVEELTSEHAQAKVHWSQQVQFYYYYDANERVFGLHLRPNPYMFDLVAVYFEPETANINQYLTISLSRVFEIYDIPSGGASDYRYLEWMSKTDNNYVTRLKLMSGFGLLRLAEAYLIGAECSLSTNQEKALEYLNALRTNRGLTQLDLTADIEAEIMNEYLKEFVTDGQMFHFYKRRAFQFIPGWSSPLGAKEYILPVPDEEKEFNPF